VRFSVGNSAFPLSAVDGPISTAPIAMKCAENALSGPLGSMESQVTIFMTKLRILLLRRAWFRLFPERTYEERVARILQRGTSTKRATKAKASKRTEEPDQGLERNEDAIYATERQIFIRDLQSQSMHISRLQESALKLRQQLRDRNETIQKERLKHMERTEALKKRLKEAADFRKQLEDSVIEAHGEVERRNLGIVELKKSLRMHEARSHEQLDMERRGLQKRLADAEDALRSERKAVERMQGELNDERQRHADELGIHRQAIDEAVFRAGAAEALVERSQSRNAELQRALDEQMKELRNSHASCTAASERERDAVQQMRLAHADAEISRRAAYADLENAKRASSVLELRAEEAEKRSEALDKEAQRWKLQAHELTVELAKLREGASRETNGARLQMAAIRERADALEREKDQLLERVRISEEVALDADRSLNEVGQKLMEQIQSNSDQMHTHGAELGLLRSTLGKKEETLRFAVQREEARRLEAEERSERIIQMVSEAFQEAGALRPSLEGATRASPAPQEPRHEDVEEDLRCQVEGIVEALRASEREKAELVRSNLDQQNVKPKVGGPSEIPLRQLPATDRRAQETSNWPDLPANGTESLRWSDSTPDRTVLLNLGPSPTAFEAQRKELQMLREQNRLLAEEAKSLRAAQDRIEDDRRLTAARVAFLEGENERLLGNLQEQGEQGANARQGRMAPRGGAAAASRGSSRGASSHSPGRTGLPELRLRAQGNAPTNAGDRQSKRQASCVADHAATAARLRERALECELLREECQHRDARIKHLEKIQKSYSTLKETNAVLRDEAAALQHTLKMMSRKSDDHEQQIKEDLEAVRGRLHQKDSELASVLGDVQVLKRSLQSQEQLYSSNLDKLIGRLRQAGMDVPRLDGGASALGGEAVFREGGGLEKEEADQSESQEPREPAADTSDLRRRLQLSGEREQELAEKLIDSEEAREAALRETQVLRRKLREADQDAESMPTDLMLANAERRMLLRELERYQREHEERERERRQEMKSVELDMRALIEKLGREREKLVQRVQDQAIVIHQLTISHEGSKCGSSVAMNDSFSRNSICSRDRKSPLRCSSPDFFGAGDLLPHELPPDGVRGTPARLGDVADVEETKAASDPRRKGRRRPQDLLSEVESRQIMLENARLLGELGSRSLSR